MTTGDIAQFRSIASLSPQSENSQTLAALAAIVQSSHDAIIGKSLDGRIVSWNPGAERLYGWQADEAIGQPVELLVPPDQLATERELFRRILAGERLEAFELQRMHKSGARLDVSLSMSPIFDPNSVIIGVASSSRDIGERRRTELRFQRILDAAPDAMVGVDRTGAVTFVNAGVERLFQYGAGELLGKPVELLLPHGVRDRHARHRVQYLTDPMPRLMGAGHQLFGRRRDGSTFPADISLAPVDSQLVVSPDQLMVVAAVRDASARFAAEGFLRESEERFRQVTESIEVGFTLREVDPPSYLYISPGYREIVGLSDDEVNPSRPLLRDLVHPEDEPILVPYLGLADAGLPAEVELRIVRNDGAVRWVRATSTPVPSQVGSPTRIAGTLEDITVRKNGEAAVRSAQIEAERANAAKSEFLSRMSHELRTPLNAVLGFGQLLELDPLTETQSDSVQHILRGGRHLLEMIDDVLDISRIETDQLEISLEPVAVNRLLTETIGLLRPLAAAGRIEVSLQADEAAPERYVLADNRRLRQVMLNLLSNAIKYNRAPGWVRLGYQDDTEGRLLLWVQDSGLGINEQDLPRLFVPFDRLGDQSADIEGTGIGLALSQRLVTVMHGTLAVQSQRGHGSTFSVALPTTSLVAADGPLPPLHAPGAAAGGDGPRRTLLYIEDNLSNLQLLERILQRCPGWSLLHAGHGALGLELAASTRPDLILLDIHLPDMNGLEVLRELQSHSNTAVLPVVVVSADASPQQVQRARDGGAEQYLTKPLHVGDVLALLDRHARREVRS